MNMAGYPIFIAKINKGDPHNYPRRECGKSSIWKNGLPVIIWAL
jgi:hypothetical protein